MILKNQNIKLINNNKKETSNEYCNCRNQATKMATAEQKMLFTKLAQKMIINCKPENKNYNQYINSTELSKLIQKLKQKNTDYDLSWKVLLKESRLGKNTCRLCFKEAFLILQADSNCIDKKSERMGTCRHENNFLLMNWKEKIS